MYKYAAVVYNIYCHIENNAPITVHWMVSEALFIVGSCFFVFVTVTRARQEASAISSFSRKGNLNSLHRECEQRLVICCYLCWKRSVTKDVGMF